MQRRIRFRRSAGTATPIDVLRRLFRPPSKALIAADLAAIDRGEGRSLACLFRGDHGEYPRRFRRKYLDLAPEALVLRHFWSSPSRSTFRIPREDVTSAWVRPRNRGTDVNVPATGVYSPGGIFSYAGFETVTCETAAGEIELAVPRPDVPLMLHYINSRGRAQARPAKDGQLK